MRPPGGAVEFHQVVGSCEPEDSLPVFHDGVDRLIQMKHGFGRSPKGRSIVSQAVGSAQPEGAPRLHDHIADQTGKGPMLWHVLFAPIHEPEQRRAFNTPNAIWSEPT